MKKRLSILIVDDNTGFVERMTGLLIETGSVNRIDTACTYDEADILLAKKPDLVLLDIRLPGKNGICLLKKIKKTVKNCEVVMVTNYTGEHYREQCREHGASLFLDKTNDFEQVPRLVMALTDPLEIN